MASILIVDKDEAILKAFEKILSKEEHKVLTIKNWEDRINITVDSTPELIIVDFNFDEESLNTLVKLKSNYNTSSFLLMTAYSNDITSKDILKLGVDDYITKPFSVNLMKEKINYLVKKFYQRS